jgi:UDP-N-acetylglucosamine:LPS N-acetylglucosamine transferase
VWLGGPDTQHLESITAGLADIKVLDFVENIHDWIGASDLVITKGTRGTTMDAAALGVPSVAISFGQNIMDELMVPRIRTHTHLNARALSARSFGNAILALLSEPPPAPIRWADESKVAPALNAAIRDLAPM